jgi:hypothetical protein
MVAKPRKGIVLGELTSGFDVEAAEKANLQGKMSWMDIAELHENHLHGGMAPQAEAHLKAMLWWNKLSLCDREDFARMTGHGVQGKSWRHIASVDPSIMSAMLEANPELTRDKERFKKWLKDNSAKGGAKYRVPGAKL